MNLKEAISGKDLRSFFNVHKDIYQDNIYYRCSEEDITRMLVQGTSAFHSHASVIPYIILENDKIAGRFALIHDHKLPEYVQVSFFEAQPGIADLSKLILREARFRFPGCHNLVAGLNGHLNYGAGILISNFEEPPVFGLPYNREYYQDYFRDFKKTTMVSYRFPLEPFVEYHKKMGENPDFKGITVRKLNKKRLRQETEIYTYLNNACFPGHPYWADRDAREDFELFHPFRFLIKEENLLFAEKDGEPIGFFLWYPDFNQLLKNGAHLGLKQVLRYHLFHPVDTFRFTEIAVLPQYKISHAVQAMILTATPYIYRSGIKYGEGGFIFEENINSIVMTRRFLERVTGEKMEPYRRYAVFECAL